MKACSKCGGSKDESEFYRSKKSRDGLTSWCRPCSSKANSACKMKQYWADSEFRDRQKKRSLDYYYSKDRRPNVGQYRRWSEEDPERVRTLLKCCLTIKEIAEKTGIGEARVAYKTTGLRKEIRLQALESA